MQYIKSNYLLITFLAITLFTLGNQAYADSSTSSFDNTLEYTVSNTELLEVNSGIGTLKKTFTASDIVGDLGSSQGTTSLDADGDGDTDIYTINYGEQNKLWINDGTGSFTASDIAGDLGFSTGTTTLDADGDGDDDIYATNWGTQNKLWMNDGTGAFTASDIAGDSGYSSGAISLDADGDGDVDIYTANYSNEQNKLWINDGTGSFIASDIAGDLAFSRATTSLDADGDGDVDIYVVNWFGQQNRLWINDGTGSFTASDIAGDLGASLGTYSLDANGDGNDDIYTANHGEQNKLWINDGTGSFTASDITGDLGSSYGATSLDANGDGNDDIYTANHGEQNKLWINDGTGAFTASDINGDLGSSHATTSLDADRDGDDDIYVVNYSDEQNKLWLNNFSTTRPYIQPNDPIVFTTDLSSFTDTLSVNNEGTIAYQVSSDNGVTWKYWDGLLWQATALVDGTETNTSNEINANIQSLDTDGGDFIWRAYFVSDGVQKVELNQIDVTYDIVVEVERSSKKSSVIRYVCKDENATNYSRFGRHKASLCLYQEKTIFPVNIIENINPSSEINPFGGNVCSPETTLHDFMMKNDKNGSLSSSNNKLITEVNLLQEHMNRLLLDEYGNQASGPVDGIFGELTRRGVERLQKHLNLLLPEMNPLDIDGIVGPFTRQAINYSC